MAERTSSASTRRTRPATHDAIGNFVIDKEIGKGSFAQVYSARHKVRDLCLLDHLQVTTTNPPR